MEKQPVYIVAVSGGVDSVVLLHKLVKAAEVDLVVAHFDHGTRSDSAEDRKFVQDLAKKYDLPFEYTEGKLGAITSEAKARTARYKFLRSVQKKYQADGIVTAHHQDDLIETAIINLLRGTKSRGLSSLRSDSDLKRPLLKYTKFKVIKYAYAHSLRWREDPSNLDTKYLRNYVRQVLIPKLDEVDPGWREQFLDQIKKASRLNKAMDSLLAELESQMVDGTEGALVINRVVFAGLPGPIGRELVRRWLGRLGSPKLDQAVIKRAWLFAKTAKPGTRLRVSKQISLSQGAEHLIIASGPKQ